MKHLNFKPRLVRYLYLQGLQDGKKVLVLGHSHYCKYKDGPCFERCTSSVCGCREWKLNCPHMEEIQEFFPYEWKEKGLALNTKTEIRNYLKGNYQITYEKFSKFMCQYFNLSKEEFWNKIAFYNYVQYFLPYDGTEKSRNGADKEWITKDEENDLAFEEMLTELPDLPDVIIAWGKVGNHLYDKYRTDGEPEKYKYLFQVKLQNKIIWVLNCHHPYYPLFEDGGNLKNSMNILFREGKS